MRFNLFVVISLSLLSGFISMPSTASCGSEDISEAGEIEVLSESQFYSEANENNPRMERAFTLLFANPTRKNALLFIIDHRNRVPMDEEPFDNLLGFDGGGLKVGLGLRYGILTDLDTGVYRLNGTTEAFDIYQFDLRYRFLNQKDHFIDAAILPGFTLFSQTDEEDASGWLLQLLASRTFDRVRIGIGILYHSDSSNDIKKNTDDASSASIQSICEIWFHPLLAWDLEISTHIAGYGSAHPQISSGFKIITNRHTFSIVVSNTQYTSADSVVTNTNRDFRDVILGFSITREFEL